MQHSEKETYRKCEIQVERQKKIERAKINLIGEGEKRYITKTIFEETDDNFPEMTTDTHFKNYNKQ